MAFGCGGSSPRGLDADPDAGTELDAGPDAGTELDAGPDAGTEFDAGPDAGTELDAGPDAGAICSKERTCTARITGAETATFDCSGLLGSVAYPSNYQLTIYWTDTRLTGNGSSLSLAVDLSDSLSYHIGGMFRDFVEDLTVCGHGGCFGYHYTAPNFWSRPDTSAGSLSLGFVEDCRRCVSGCQTTSPGPEYSVAYVGTIDATLVRAYADGGLPLPDAGVGSADLLQLHLDF